MSLFLTLWTCNFNGCIIFNYMAMSKLTRQSNTGPTSFQHLLSGRDYMSKCVCWSVPGCQARKSNRHPELGPEAHREPLLDSHSLESFLALPRIYLIWLSAFPGQSKWETHNLGMRSGAEEELEAGWLTPQEVGAGDWCRTRTAKSKSRPESNVSKAEWGHLRKEQAAGGRWEHQRYSYLCSKEQSCLADII